LTFNTTSLSLVRALREGRLRLHQPLRLLGDQMRYLIVTPEIEDLLNGRRLLGLFPDVESEILIGRYAAGNLVTVSRKITKAKPDVEQIVGPDEV
jgi:hypothetical protein